MNRCMVALSDQAETKCPPSDGCGLISPSILQTIQRNVRLPEIPSAVQLRFFGAKGVCLNDLQYAKSSEDDSLITLRPSQVKINCDERYLYDPAKLTVDVVRVAALKIGASLSAEAIIILAESGVPHETLCQIYRHALQEDFSPFLHLPHFSSPLIALIHAVFRLGGVMSERRARAYGGAARARGAISGWRTGENELGSLGPIADEDESEDEGDDGDTLFDEPAGQSLAWYPDDISGLPSSLPETCLLLMLSGFRPDQLEYCGKKLHSFLKTALDGRISKYRLPIPLSVSGIIVPGKSKQIEDIKTAECQSCCSRSHLYPWSGRDFCISFGATYQSPDWRKDAEPHRRLSSVSEPGQASVRRTKSTSRNVPGSQTTTKRDCFQYHRSTAITC